MPKTKKKATKKSTKPRQFKPGELKRKLGIPEPKGRSSNDPKYCRMISRLMRENLKAGKYDGILRQKAVYYANWYAWRAKNDRKEAA